MLSCTRTIPRVAKLSAILFLSNMADNIQLKYNRAYISKRADERNREHALGRGRVTYVCGIWGLAVDSCCGEGRAAVQADERPGGWTGRLTGEHGNRRTGGRAGKRASGRTVSRPAERRS